MKVFYSILFSIFLQCLIAQPVFQKEHITEYESFLMYRKLYLDSIPTNIGINQIWDFSISISSIFWGYNTIWSDSNLDLITGANRSWYRIVDYEGNPTTLGYYENHQFQVNDSGFYKLFYRDLNTYLDYGEQPIQLQNPSLVYPLPLTYPDTFNSSENYILRISSNSTHNDSVRYRISKSKHSLVDGYGNVILRTDTFEVLRIHQDEIQVDSIDYYISGEWTFIKDTIINRESIQFLSPELAKFALLAEKQLDISGNSRWYITYYDGIFVNSINDKNKPLLCVFPNPARDFIQIKSDFPIDFVELYDLQGRKLLSIMKPQENIIPLNHLESGIYIIRVSSKNQSHTQKVILTP